MILMYCYAKEHLRRPNCSCFVLFLWLGNVSTQINQHPQFLSILFSLCVQLSGDFDLYFLESVTKSQNHSPNNCIMFKRLDESVFVFLT